MTCVALYDSSGVVKESLHPNRLAVLRAKSRNAHVVSTVFVSGYVPCNVPAGLPERQQGL